MRFFGFPESSSYRDSKVKRSLFVVSYVLRLSFQVEMMVLEWKILKVLE